MKNHIQLTISLGLLIALAMMFSLVTDALIRSQYGTNSLTRFFEIAAGTADADSDGRGATTMRTGRPKAMNPAPDRSLQGTAEPQSPDQAAGPRLPGESLDSPGMETGERGFPARLSTAGQKARSRADATAEPVTGPPAAAQKTGTGEAAVPDQGRAPVTTGGLQGRAETASAAVLAAGREHERVMRRLHIVLFMTGGCLLLLSVQLLMRWAAKKPRPRDSGTGRDALTGLITRREFEYRVERAIEHAQTHSATHTLLHIDIDQFKALNETCGQCIGDELLRQIAQLLMSSVRRRDTLGRLGGDEFGMLLENCPLGKAVDIAGKLLSAMEGFHFNSGKDSIPAGISIGVVPLDRSTASLASAMHAADSACYIARGAGRNRLQVAQPGDRRLQERHGRMQWVSRLGTALGENRFALFFQPIVPCSTPSGHGRYIEILLRMIDDDGSVIAPGVFLPAAEEYGLVTRIDRWVIEHSLAWLARRGSRYQRPIMITINLSGQSICDPAMQGFILECVERHAISAGQVCFEITETAVTDNITAVTGFMLTMRGYGFRFSLDDFGSGLSSFAYLKKLPVDFLKIDGTSVRDILCDPFDHATVRAIIELSRLLGKKTIAEGVETMGVADELKHMGVDYVQGFVHAHPQSLDDYEQASGPQLIVISSR